MRTLRLLLCLVMLAPAGLAWADVFDDVNSGVKAQQAGDLDRAMVLYTRVIDSQEFEVGDTVLAWVYHNRGLIHALRNQSDKAIEDYTKGLEVLPDHMLYFNRGRALAAKGDDRQAIEDYTKCLEIYPDFLRAYQLRGLSLLNIGDAARAKADLSKANIKNTNLKF